MLRSSVLVGGRIHTGIHSQCRALIPVATAAASEHFPTRPTDEWSSESERGRELSWKWCELRERKTFFVYCEECGRGGGGDPRYQFSVALGDLKRTTVLLISWQRVVLETVKLERAVNDEPGL